MQTALSIIIGAVWVFHGFYSKILNGIPRHRRIIAKILGVKMAEPATFIIGTLEVLLGFWVFSGFEPIYCASVITLGLISMNTLEIIFAQDLLISAPGMVVLNILYAGLVWIWATSVA